MEANAYSHKKIVVKIEENNEYWKSQAEFKDGHRDFDNGIGGVYVSKIDGSIKGLDLWDTDFNRKFAETSKTVFLNDVIASLINR